MPDLEVYWFDDPRFPDARCGTHAACPYKLDPWSYSLHCVSRWCSIGGLNRVLLPH